MSQEGYDKLVAEQEIRAISQRTQSMMRPKKPRPISKIKSTR